MIFIFFSKFSTIHSGLHFKARLIGFVFISYEGRFHPDITNDAYNIVKNFFIEFGLMIYQTMITILCLSWFD